VLAFRALGVAAVEDSSIAQQYRGHSPSVALAR
jgi:hypothetical protein